MNCDATAGTDSPEGCGQCGMPRDITHTMLGHARQIAGERNANAVLVCGGHLPDTSVLDFQGPQKTIFLLTGESQPDESHVGGTIIRVPNMPPTRMSQVRMGILLALSRGLLEPRDQVVCVTGMTESELLDTVVIISVGDEFEMFLGPDRGEWDTSDLRPDVLQRTLELATELALEGREGHAIGALFVVGDLENVLPKTHQMVLNPFHGYPPERRNILDRAQVAETAKEFSTIDGAFLVHGNGTIESVGTHIDSALMLNEHLPQGLGARHRAAAAITAATNAVAVVLSQSTGSVTVFRKGRIVAEIPKPVGPRAHAPGTPAGRGGDRVVVVGGGITGLSIAWRLAEAGTAVTLLEAGTLGAGVTLRNQGWLRSGALIAPRQPRLAAMTYAALRKSLELCPECVEPGTGEMLYLLTRPESDAAEWTKAWHACGIPYTPVDLNDIARELPGIDPAQVRSGFRLPDRSIRFDVLLNRLAMGARRAGVDIRTETRVTALLDEDDAVRAVRTAAGEVIPTRLLVLAADAATEHLLRTLQSPAGRAARESGWTDRFPVIKSHLVAVRPGLSATPFCIADQDGFNHLPHGEVSVFHSNRWVTTADHADHSVAEDEVLRIRQMVRGMFPGFPEAEGGSLEWASTTVRCLSEGSTVADESLPRVTTHEPLSNLVSAIAGRATRWPIVADEAFRVISGKLISSSATPPWRNF